MGERVHFGALHCVRVKPAGRLRDHDSFRDSDPPEPIGGQGRLCRQPADGPDVFARVVCLCGAVCGHAAGGIGFGRFGAPARRDGDFRNRSRAAVLSAGAVSVLSAAHAKKRRLDGARESGDGLRHPGRQPEVFEQPGPGVAVGIPDPRAVSGGVDRVVFHGGPIPAWLCASGGHPTG